MNDIFFLGLFVGALLAPLALVVLFLLFAVAVKSRLNRQGR